MLNNIGKMGFSGSVFIPIKQYTIRDGVFDEEKVEKLSKLEEESFCVKEDCRKAGRIYTTTDSSKESDKKLVGYLIDKGFDFSYLTATSPNIDKFVYRQKH